MKISANGISMNYTFDGPANAPVVTMSHSLATDFGMWDPTVPALTGRFRVLRYETRGHGKTEAPRGAYSLDQLADDALALLREPTLARWFTAPFREKKKDVVETVATMIRTTPVAGYVGCCQAISALNLTDRLSAIKLPTVVIVGEDDPGTPVAASRVIAENIKGAQLEIIPAAAHLSNLEQPEKFNRALSAFLTSAG